MKPILLSMALALVAVGLLAGIPQSADATSGVVVSAEMLVATHDPNIVPDYPSCDANKIWNKSNRFVQKPNIDSNGNVTHSGKNYLDEELFTTVGFLIRKPGYDNRGKWEFIERERVNLPQKYSGDSEDRLVKACVKQVTGFTSVEGPPHWYILSPVARWHR